MVAEREHEHGWVETRITMIRRDCECGATEIIPNKRGLLRGRPKFKQARPKSVKPVSNWQLRGPVNPVRAEEMKRLYTEDLLTMQQIADRYGMSRARVGQILGWQLGVSYRDVQSLRHPAPPETLTCRLCGQEYPYGKGLEHLRAISHRRINQDRHANRERDDAIVADYEAGMLIRDICAKYGINATSITYALAWQGKTPNRRATSRRLPIAEAQARKRLILADYIKGETMKVIAERYGVSDSWVALIAKEAGVFHGRGRKRV